MDRPASSIFNLKNRKCLSGVFCRLRKALLWIPALPLLFSIHCQNKAVGDSLSTIFLFDGINPPMYTLSGTVTGLCGTNLVLGNSNGDSVTLSIPSCGSPQTVSYTFPQTMHTDDVFNISIENYPTSFTQFCWFTGTTVGTIGNSNIADINLTCQDAYSIVEPAVTGLTGGGLKLSNNGVDLLSIPAPGSGSYTFHTPVILGSSYSILVASQPTSPWQVCDFSGSSLVSGTVSADVTLPTLTCSVQQYHLTVSSTSLTYSGLQLTVTLNGSSGSPLSIPTTPSGYDLNGGTALDSGTTYRVAITTQPAGESCSIFGGSDGNGGAETSGIIAGSGVNFTISCSVTGYPVGGTIMNLNGTLSLGMTGTVPQSLNVAGPIASGSYTFSTALNYGNSYAVSITGQPVVPAEQTCTFDPGSLSGTVSTSAISLPIIRCVDHSWDVAKWDAGIWK